MGRDDWYRSADWGPEDQAEFERRLRRSRPFNAAQNLPIKGIALAEAGRVDDAKALWLRVVEEPAYEGQRVVALEHLADFSSRTIRNRPRRSTANSSPTTRP